MSSTWDVISREDDHSFSEGFAAPYWDVWLSEATRGVAIVRRDLSIVWANPIVDRLFEKSVRIEAGHLYVGAPETTTSLREFVCGLQSLPQVWACCVGPDEHLVVRADPVSPASLPPGAVLTFQLTSEATNHLAWADLRQALGLTRSETAIVKLLLSGQGAEDVASETTASLETVRTHIKRIYAKLGVGSREQLFAKVLRYRVG